MPSTTPTPGPPREITAPDGSPAWLLTRYAEVRAALADPRLSLDKRNSRSGYVGFRLPPALDANLLNMDPPDHTRIRRLLTQAFTMRRVQALRPQMTDLAERLAGDLAAAGGGDLIAGYAAPLAVTVICDLLGIPPAARRDFRAWTTAILAPPPTPDSHAKAEEAVAALLGFLRGLIADARGEPGEDLISGMVAARDEGDRLSEDELVSLIFLTLFAGYENSVNLIGNAALALLSDVDLAARLRAEPAGIPELIEDTLARRSPAQAAFRRFALEDVRYGDVTIPAGSTVLASIAAANADPDRGDGPHTSFGHGIHYCVGAPLARIEGEVAIATLLRTLPGMSAAVQPDSLEWIPSTRVLGLRALRVEC